jgi:predicted transport protein
LFYLDWLLDHKADFKLLVMDRLGADGSAQIDWTGPRLLCVAGDFTKYDEHAVQQINRNIELIRYRRFADDLLLFELVNATVGTPLPTDDGPIQATSGTKPAKVSVKSAADRLAEATPPVRDSFETLQAFLLSLGDDVQLKQLHYYFAFKRLKNFATVDFQSDKFKVFVKVPPESVELEQGFTRDVTEVGHWGTGDLEITIGTVDHFERAKPLLLKSYEIS